MTADTENKVRALFSVQVSDTDEPALVSGLSLKNAVSVSCLKSGRMSAWQHFTYALFSVTELSGTPTDR